MILERDQYKSHISSPDGDQQVPGGQLEGGAGGCLVQCVRYDGGSWTPP